VAVSLAVLIAATLTEGCWTRQGLTLQSAHAQAVQNAAYVVFIDVADGNKIKARNNITGEVEYYGADAAAVLQNAIDALASAGGSILLTRGTYVWQSVPGLPKDLPNWLKIVGDGDVTIQLTTNGPRAFDFRKIADYDTFQNIWLEGFTVDCNNIGGKHHVVLGTYIGGAAQTRINIQNIVIRDIATRNVPVDSTETNHRLNVWIVVRHPATGETETVIKDILVEHCDFQGGNMGVVIGGSGPVAVNLKVFLDGIRIHNCRHSLLSVQSRLFSSANFFVGARGYGGSVHISDCYGEYSGDVGVEVNAMTHVLVENCQMIDAVAAGYYHVNYNNPAKADEQTVTFRNCVAQRLRLGISLAGIGFSVLDSLSVPLGNLAFDNCSFYGVTNRLQEGNCVSIAPTSNVRSVSLLNCRFDVENFAFNQAETAAASPVYINFAGSAAGDLQIRGLQIKVRGSRAGAGEFYVVGLHLNGKVKMSLEGISTDMSITDSTPGGLLGLILGDLASTMDGSILRYKPTFAADTYPSGIRVGGTGTLTISSQLRIENCDFTAMTGGTEFYFGSPSNSGKVTLLSNKLKSFSAGRFAIGPQFVGIAGQSLAYGDFCALKSDGKWWKSDAQQTSLMPVAAMALGTISANAEGIFLSSEVAHDDSWSWTVGGTLYASTAAGELTQVAPSGPGVQVQLVGIANLVTEILFNPSTPATTTTLTTTTLTTTSFGTTALATTSQTTSCPTTSTSVLTSQSSTTSTTATGTSTTYQTTTSGTTTSATTTPVTTQITGTSGTTTFTTTTPTTSRTTTSSETSTLTTSVQPTSTTAPSTSTSYTFTSGSTTQQTTTTASTTSSFTSTTSQTTTLTQSSGTTVTSVSTTPVTSSTTTSSASTSPTSTSIFTSQYSTTTTSSSSTSTTSSSMTTTASFTSYQTTSSTSKGNSKGTCRLILDASPKTGLANKPVTISGTLYGSWNRIKDGVVVGNQVEISTSWGFKTIVTTDNHGRFSTSTNCPSMGGTYVITATSYEDQDLAGCSAIITYQVSATTALTTTTVTTTPAITKTTTTQRIATTITIAKSGTTFYGRLTDAYGNPLGNKPLTIYYEDEGRMCSRSLVTDDNGNWSFSIGGVDSARITFAGDIHYLPCKAAYG